MVRLVATQYHLQSVTIYTANTSPCQKSLYLWLASKNCSATWIQASLHQTHCLKKPKQWNCPVSLSILPEITRLRSGPSWLHQGMCHPHLQKGGWKRSQNYRPISLTYILCKVMEHIVASNLSRHFEQNDNPVWLPTMFPWKEVLWNPAHSACWRACPKYLSMSTNRPNFTWFQ